jgi:hypothetical protein
MGKDFNSKDFNGKEFNFKNTRIRFWSDDDLDEGEKEVWRSPFLKASVFVLALVACVLLFVFGVFSLLFVAAGIAILGALILALAPIVQIADWLANRKKSSDA